MPLRDFNEVHVEEDCSQLTGQHDNGLFFGCTFSKLNGLTLKDCDLNRSKFVTDSIRDALDFCITLNCHSFKNVELSPLVFDLIISLLTMTTGNDEKREQLIQVIGQHRYEAMMKVLRVVE